MQNYSNGTHLVAHVTSRLLPREHCLLNPDCAFAGASQRTYDTATVNKVVLAVLMSVPNLLDPSVVAAANDGSLYAVSLLSTSRDVRNDKGSY